jgi:hypothetical protein
MIIDKSKKKLRQKRSVKIELRDALDFLKNKIILSGEEEEKNLNRYNY